VTDAQFVDMPDCRRKITHPTKQCGRLLSQSLPPKYRSGLANYPW